MADRDATNDDPSLLLQEVHLYIMLWAGPALAA